MANIFDKVRGLGLPLTQDTEESLAKANEDKRIEGKIINLNEAGWGFISSREIKFTRIFFHWTSLKQNTLNFINLKKGMPVSFIAINTDNNKGFRAIKIEVIEFNTKKEE